jgi:hypothetical protein
MTFESDLQFVEAPRATCIFSAPECNKYACPLNTPGNFTLCVSGWLKFLLVSVDDVIAAVKQCLDVVSFLWPCARVTDEKSAPSFSLATYK